MKLLSTVFYHLPQAVLNGLLLLSAVQVVPKDWRELLVDGYRQSEREWVVMIAAWWIICGAELIRFGSF